MPDPLPSRSPDRRGPGLLPAALLALGFLPVMLAYLGGLWDKPWYRWFPLALVGTIVFAVRAAREPVPPAGPGERWLWLPVLGLGLGLLGAAIKLNSTWLGWLAGLFALAGVVGWSGGWALFCRMLPAGVLLAVLLAPPLNWDTLAVQRLERLILLAAGRMLYGLSVPHLLYPGGVVLTDLNLPRSELFTGLYGLPGVLGAGLVWLLARRRGPVRILCTLLATAVLLLPGEVARIAWGIAASDAAKADFFATQRSQWVVIGVWVLNFVLFLSMDQFMRFLTMPRRKPDLPPASLATDVWPGARTALGLAGPASGVAWGFAALALALGAVRGAQSWTQAGVQAQAAAPVAGRLKAAARFTLPDWPEWRALPGSNSLAQAEAPGATLGAWHRQRGDLALAVTLSGPLPGFASPIPLYQERLWRLSGWAPVLASGGTPPPAAEAELRRDALFHGVLWFGLLDESGQWLTPSVRQAWSGASPGAAPPRACYLVQALAVGPRNPTKAEREEIRRRFEEARQQFARQLTPQLEARP